MTLIAKPRVLCNRSSEQPVQGFTLLELMTMLAMISILFAIAAPIWMSLFNSLRLNAATDQIVQAMRTAQQQAKLDKVVQEFGVREANIGVQWATYPESSQPQDALWHSLDPNIQIDPETTLKKDKGVYRMQFNDVGAVNGQLGRLTLVGKGFNQTKRCVIVSTLLGTIRQGTEHPNPDAGKYCY